MEMSEIRVTPQLSPEITESIHFQTLWYPIKLAKFFREDGFEFYYKGESLGEDFDILASCSEITFENRLPDSGHWLSVLLNVENVTNHAANC